MNGHYNVGDIVLNSWTLTRLLGQDSVGCVYEATQNDTGQTSKAAIKIITIPQNLNDIKNIMADGMDKESVIEYFKGSIRDLLEEFLLMTKLQNCSNIVQYDEHMVTEHTAGIGWDIFLRMELLTSLVDYAHVKPLRRENIIQLGIDICRALEYCEDYGIIHRDIKPGNIFISRKGEFMLGDFGIARTIDKTAGGFTKNAYTAPELYRGEHYKQSVDIYSLGIVLYRMLNNNRTPFMPDYPTPITHNSREKALAKQLQGFPFPKPASADGALVDVVLKACAFDADKRYVSATAMREDLEAVLNGNEIVPTSTPSAPPVPPTPIKESDLYGSYEGAETSFYQSLKERASSSRASLEYTPEPEDIPDSDSDGFEYISQPDTEESLFIPPKPSHNVPFDFEPDEPDELYDVDSEKTFVSIALDFLKERFVIVLLAAGAVLVLITAFILINPFGAGEDPIIPEDPVIEEDVVPPPTEPITEPITIPDFSMQSFMQLSADPRYVDVFTFLASEAFSDYVPVGFIISQSPEPHTQQQLSPGDRVMVNVVVSMGPEPSPLDYVTSIEIRYGPNRLPGRAANNPGLTLRLEDDPTIVLTVLIEPTDLNLEQYGIENLGAFIEWTSSDESILEITFVNPDDSTIRITAVDTGSAYLVARVGEHEDRARITIIN